MVSIWDLNSWPPRSQSLSLFEFKQAGCRVPCVRYPFFSRLPTYDKKLRRKISRFCFFLVLPSINAEKCHSPFFTGDRRCGCLFLRPSAVDCFRKTAFMIVMRDSQNAGCVKKTARCIFGFWGEAKTGNPPKSKNHIRAVSHNEVAVGESARTLRMSSKNREGDLFRKRRISGGECVLRHPKCAENDSRQRIPCRIILCTTLWLNGI